MIDDGGGGMSGSDFEREVSELARARGHEEGYRSRSNLSAVRPSRRHRSARRAARPGQGRFQLALRA